MHIPPWAPALSDGTVTLRAHCAGDVPDVLAQCRDPQTQRWTSVPVPYERSDAERFVSSREAEWTAGRYLAFAIEEGGRFAGTVDLRPSSPTAAEIGYGLGPWARRRGVMSRTLRLVLPWAFDQLGLDVVHWRAVAGNWASRRAAWAVGFRVEGLVRGLLDDHGTPSDGWIGSLLRTDPLTPAHPWIDPPLLVAPGVRLRPHRVGDVQRTVEACRDALTQRWLPELPTEYTATDALAHLEEIREHHANGRSAYWVFTGSGDDQLAGEIGLFGIGGSSHSGELGYWTHPEARGRKLTTRAVQLAARHALSPVEAGGLGLNRLVIRVAEGNLASQRVALGAGFYPAGIDRRAEELRDGTVSDLFRFDRIRDDLRMIDGLVDIAELIDYNALPEAGPPRDRGPDHGPGHDPGRPA